MSQVIEASNWRWHGLAGHFICGDKCQFHLCTTVGDYLVSTVGAMVPDAPIREIYAKSRGLDLQGIGDARETDFLNKNGFEKLGSWGTYETMVFKFSGKGCEAEDCRYGGRCGSPRPDSFSDLDGERYDSAADATAGHYSYCEKAARGEIGERIEA